MQLAAICGRPHQIRRAVAENRAVTVFPIQLPPPLTTAGSSDRIAPDSHGRGGLGVIIVFEFEVANGLALPLHRRPCGHSQRHDHIDPMGLLLLPNAPAAGRLDRHGAGGGEPM
jgi:hypothetical protein